MPRFSDGLAAYVQLSESRSVLGSLRAFYTDREHGTKANCVPREWGATARRHAFWPVYALSPFCFSAVGVCLLCALAQRPERQLHAAEHVEGGLWIIAGLISFACDVHDLARPSISHPVDRLSATSFTALQLGKHATFALRGDYQRLPAWLRLLFAAGLWLGFHCFQRSVRAVNERRLGSYLLWHSAWHFVWPAVSVVMLRAHYYREIW